MLYTEMCVRGVSNIGKANDNLIWPSYICAVLIRYIRALEEYHVLRDLHPLKKKKKN